MGDRMLLLLLFVGAARAYIATVEVEINRFETLNRNIISMANCCDDNGWFGKYNPCDFRFRVQNCSRLDGRTYECDETSPMFKAPDNQDDVTFLTDKPFRAFVIEPFERELVVNITVEDGDEGFTSNDFVGNYILRFTPTMISRTNQVPGSQEHIIVIPGHSRLTLSYRAYCNDVECQNKPLNAFRPDFGGIQRLNSVDSRSRQFHPPEQRGGNLRWSPELQREQDRAQSFLSRDFLQSGGSFNFQALDGGYGNVAPPAPTPGPYVERRTTRRTPATTTAPYRTRRPVTESERIVSPVTSGYTSGGYGNGSPYGGYGLSPQRSRLVGGRDSFGSPFAPGPDRRKEIPADWADSHDLAFP